MRQRRHAGPRHSLATYRLVLLPHGREGLGMVDKRPFVNDLAVLEREDVGEGRLELDPGVPHLRAGAVERDHTLASVDDLVQVDNEPLKRLYPRFCGSEGAVKAAL